MEKKTTKKAGKAGTRGNGPRADSAAAKRYDWQGGGWLRKTTRRRIYMRDDFCCIYCGASALDSAVSLTVDHVLPRELGGTNAHSNLVTCCKSCNSSKQDKPLARFLRKIELDKGIDGESVARRIRNTTRRQLPKLAQ